MVNYWSNTQLFMSHVYWAITSQYSIINYPITGFINTFRFITLPAIRDRRQWPRLWGMIQLNSLWKRHVGIQSPYTE